MIAAYPMKINGVWYGVGDEVQTDNHINVNSVAENQAVSTSKYTRTAIHQMNIDRLRELAIQEGIPNAETQNGTSLKRDLIEHFGL